LGRGEQFVSWISLVDEVKAILRVVEDERLEGAVNVCAPEPVTNAEFTRALGRALRRPAALVVPRRVVEAVLGREMAGELLFASQRVRPARLEAVGHAFAHPDLDGALAALLGPAA
jgi:NAD dependent epimerase/dehydratase family enzyme